MSGSIGERPFGVGRGPRSQAAIKAELKETASYHDARLAARQAKADPAAVARGEVVAEAPAPVEVAEALGDTMLTGDAVAAPTASRAYTPAELGRLTQGMVHHPYPMPGYQVPAYRAA